MSAVTNRASMPESTLDKLASLPPADDAEAQAPTYPPLGLTDADIATLQRLSEAWRVARQQATQAEQRYTAASRLALRLPELKRDAGEVAAAAFGRNGSGQLEAQGITDKIKTAKQAEAAMPALKRAADAAKDHAGDCRGALHGATVAALHGSLRRASDRYSMLALELTRTVAAIDAAIMALPSSKASDATAGFSLFMLRLSVPDLPRVELRVPPDRAAQDVGFTTSLLAADHARLAAHLTASHGWLAAQLKQGLSEVPVRILLG